MLDGKLECSSLNSSKFRDPDLKSATVEPIQYLYIYKTGSQSSRKVVFVMKKEDNSLVCYKSDITQNSLFFRRSFWKFNFLAITEEREIYLIISISKECMESYQFPYTYTVISGFWMLKITQNNKILSCVTLVANKRYILCLWLGLLWKWHHWWI